MRYFCGISLLVIVTASLHAQNKIVWEPVPSAFDGDFGSLFFTSRDTIILTTRAGGIARSTDEGVSWSLSNSGLPKDTVVSAAIHPHSRYIYCTLQKSGIYSSNDNATTWLYYASAPIQNAQLFFDSSGVFYVWSDEEGIYRSTDEGATWNRIYHSVTSARQTAIGVVGNTLLIGTESDGVFRSSDSGVSWSNVWQGGVRALDFHTTKDGLVYMSSEIGLQYSSDSGMTWQRRNPPRPLPDVVSKIISDGKGTLYALSNGVYVSYDSAQGWTWSGSPYMDIIAVNEDNILVGAQRNTGVFRSPDSARTWSIRSKSVRNHSVFRVCMTEGGMFALATSNGFYRSYDGMMWESGSTILDIDIDATGNLHAVRAHLRGAIRSTDNGSTWHVTFVDSNEFIDPKLSRSVHGDIYLMYDSGNIHKTSDYGETWMKIAKMDSINKLQSFAVINDSNILAYHFSSPVLRTTDLGKTWVRPQNMDALFSNNTILYRNEREVIIAWNDGLRISEDSGASWVRKRIFPFMNGGSKAIAMDSTGTIYFGASHIYRTSDKGQTFERADDGFRDLIANADLLALYTAPDSTIYAGRENNGLWRARVVTQTSVENPPVPSSAALLVGYPNPFTGSTTLEFTLPQHQHVRLTIYNSIGERVNDVLDGEYPAGTSSVSWDGLGYRGNRLPNGMYFCRLFTGTTIVTAKLVLLRP